MNGNANTNTTFNCSSNPVQSKNLIGTHKTSIYRNENNLIVRYWFTDIVTITNDSIILNNGGYYTATTKKRMNQVSLQFGLGFNVFQKDYEWFVQTSENKIFCFQQNSVIIPKPTK
tara:strand:+ start:877 stop:1224 length:348 start_codon:yes stop_codon:yes gene_type:complete